VVSPDAGGVERARAFAKRILAGTNGAGPEDIQNDVGTINAAFEIAYSRPPNGEESAPAMDFIKQQRIIYEGKSDVALRSWTDFCQMLLASNAFLYVD
jgi:hypothetical protein